MDKYMFERAFVLWKTYKWMSLHLKEIIKI